MNRLQQLQLWLKRLNTLLNPYAQLHAAKEEILLLREEKREILEAQKANEEEMRHAYEEKLRRVLLIDSMTGVFNANGLLDGILRLLDKESNRQKLPETNGDRSERRTPSICQRPLSLVVIYADGDDFKYYNDTFGHQTGDAVIHAIVAAAKRTLREDDIIFERPGYASEEVIARKGGDEFGAAILCFADRSHEIAEATAERFRKAVNSYRVWTQLIDGKPVFTCSNQDVENALSSSPISVSIGVAVIELASFQASMLNEVIDTADKALYKAKKAGGNCVIIHDINENKTWASRLNPTDSKPETRPTPGNPAPLPTPFPP